MHGADCIRLRFRMSFGERDKRRNKEFSGLPGGNSEREPPDPFPSGEVKTLCADVRGAASHARVGHCQASHAKAPMLERASGPFLLAYTCWTCRKRRPEAVWRPSWERLRMVSTTLEGGHHVREDRRCCGRAGYEAGIERTAHIQRRSQAGFSRAVQPPRR